MPWYNCRRGEAICHGWHRSSIGSQDTAKSRSKSDRRSGSANLHDSVFRATGRERSVDDADDCGQADPDAHRRLYYRQYGMRYDKKNELKPWLVKEWCIPEANAGFVAKMEDVLEVYQRPFDPLRPVVCIDEMNRQLVEETRIPCKAGQPEKVDSEYVRKGVMNVFMIAEPLAGKRDTIVTQKRTAIDFAHVLQYISDVLYPQAEKIVLVTDNLNTHTTASLYKAFAPKEARRLVERFEWHYTLKHGSWLDMAEIESSILSRQALSKPKPNAVSFSHAVRSWTSARNAECKKIHWQFTTSDARIKLAKLYPAIV